MATFKKSVSRTQKRNNKRKLSKSKSKAKKSMRKQKGGQAPSCLSNPDTAKYMTACHTANIHNTNPEADYKLISGEGAIPPSMTGGAKCNETPTQPKPLAFVDYLERTSDLISGGAGSASNFDTTSLEAEMSAASGFPQQGGSGFSINPEEMIGGLPGRSKYDSCCQPAVIDGKLVQGKDTQAICGHQMGGSANKKGKKSHKGKKGKKGKKSKKTQKRKRSNKRSNRKMKGGNPAAYPFNGEISDYDHLADGKDFAAKQPYWGAEAR